MKALVTGATGFFGKHLTKKLHELEFEICISNTTKANLIDIKNLHVYNDVKFDYIFHLAAVTKAGEYCLTHPADQWIYNQIINTNMLMYWSFYQPQAKMICMGTSCSYAPDIKMSEENYLMGVPEPSLYAYAMTKRMLLIGLQSIQQQFGLEWLYFIPSTLYGPDFELNDNHFIFDFIRNCYNAKYKDHKFVVWGGGEQRRELIYVEDAVEAMITLLNNENQIFNLGSGQDNSINEFAQIVCEIYDYNFDLVGHDLSKYVGVKSKKINTEKTEKHLYPDTLIKTNLKDGIKKSIEYFIKEYK